MFTKRKPGAPVFEDLRAVHLYLNQWIAALDAMLANSAGGGAGNWTTDDTRAAMSDLMDTANAGLDAIATELETVADWFAWDGEHRFTVQAAALTFCLMLDGLAAMSGGDHVED